MSSLRIIGGKWRRRKISFSDTGEVRPTPDRVRETLFNWLQRDVPEANCLELYAGSGILSLEALSRGASKVTLVETSTPVYQHLRSTFDIIPSEDFELEKGTASDFLGKTDSTYDIVFLDPPFNTNEADTILPLLRRANVLNAQGCVYLETNKPLDPPGGFTIHRNAKAGQVYYYLLVPE
tara:strand:- start:1894 stop:2433 length:540 start_codon:yes stop_codon:yes gene_type:complete